MAFSFGLTVGALILFLGKYSGVHVNPGVTLALFRVDCCLGNVVVPYAFFQVLGGLLAGLTLRLILASADTTSLGSTRLATGVDPIA